MSAALEANGWDGEWYRRAYYDDGTPLGSAQNIECEIDSIAQSWSVLSGAADSDRATRAMQAVVDDFNASQDRIFIKMLTVSQIEQKLLLATAGGNPPDLCAGPTSLPSPTVPSPFPPNRSTHPD